MTRRPRAAPLLLLSACLALGACSTTLAPAPPSAPAVPDAWHQAGGQQPVHAGWWRAYGDDTLNALIAEALANNHDLRMASARLAEARALAEAQAGAQWPSLDLAAGGSRARAISDVSLKPYLSTGHQELFQAAYEVDLSGRIAAALNAAEANAQASAAMRDSVQLSLTATVASTYLSLLQLDAQLALTRQTIASRQASLQLTRQREHSGHASALESAQAEAEWRNTALVEPHLLQAIQRQEATLNLLLARLPGPIKRGRPLAAWVARGLPAAGLPSELLRRRPDLAAAELQLVAADAQLAASRAALLPSLRLTASLGRTGASVLHGDPFTIWSVGGSVLAPLFNGGRLRAQVRASDARREQALTAYERATLAAFEEVDTQLDSYALVRQQLEQAIGQQQALAEALRIAQRRRAAGYASYLDELVAQRGLFAAQQGALQYQTALLQGEVALYRALGGGWDDGTHRPAAAP